MLGTLTVDASLARARSTSTAARLGRRRRSRSYGCRAGKYIVGLENEQYHIVRNLRVDVMTGKDTAKKFSFGVLSTKLDPWARMRVDGKDIGLWDEAGIPEGKHNVTLQGVTTAPRRRPWSSTIKGGARAEVELVDLE